MKEGIYFSALGRSSFCFVNRTHRGFLWWWVFWWFKFHNTDLNSKWATVALDSKAIPDGFRQEELWIWVQQIVLSAQMIPWPLAAWCRPAPGWRGWVPHACLSPAEWSGEALPRGGFGLASNLGAWAMAVFSWRLQAFRVRKQWTTEFHDTMRLLDG